MNDREEKVKKLIKNCKMEGEIVRDAMTRIQERWDRGCWRDIDEIRRKDRNLLLMNSSSSIEISDSSDSESGNNKPQDYELKDEREYWNDDKDVYAK